MIYQYGIQEQDLNQTNKKLKNLSNQFYNLKNEKIQNLKLLIFYEALKVMGILFRTRGMNMENNNESFDVKIIKSQNNQLEIEKKVKDWRSYFISIVILNKK